MPPWRCSVLYQVKNGWQKARASSALPKRSGNSGRDLRVLNGASESGLSLETCGRLWVRVMPRSARSRATAFEVIDVPRSAWTVSCPGLMPCVSQVAAISRSARRGGHVAELVAPFLDLVGGGQEPIHRARRAEVLALVEQRGVDLPGSVVDEAGAVQLRHDGRVLPRRQRPPWPRARPRARRWPAAPGGRGAGGG